jgi:serine/threonine protein kinase
MIHGLIFVLMNLTPENDIDPKQMHITDFGIAYTTQLANNTGGFTIVRGCLEYLAPELRDLTTIESTKMSDMWAVGVIGYEICVGRELNVDSEHFQEIKKRLGGQPLDLHRIPRRFSPTVHQIIRTCMAMDPTQRFTASDLRNFIRGKLTIVNADSNNIPQNFSFMGQHWT